MRLAARWVLPQVLVMHWALARQVLVMHWALERQVLAEGWAREPSPSRAGPYPDAIGQRNLTNELLPD